jgi:hypothetical protein
MAQQYPQVDNSPWILNPKLIAICAGAAVPSVFFLVTSNLIAPLKQYVANDDFYLATTLAVTCVAAILACRFAESAFCGVRLDLNSVALFVLSAFAVYVLIEHSHLNQIDAGCFNQVRRLRASGLLPILLLAVLLFVFHRRLASVGVIALVFAVDVVFSSKDLMFAGTTFGDSSAFESVAFGMFVVIVTGLKLGIRTSGLSPKALICGTSQCRSKSLVLVLHTMIAVLLVLFLNFMRTPSFCG